MLSFRRDQLDPSALCSSVRGRVREQDLQTTVVDAFLDDVNHCAFLVLADLRAGRVGASAYGSFVEHEVLDRARVLFAAPDDARAATTADAAATPAPA